jgi:hypothetical protein
MTSVFNTFQHHPMSQKSKHARYKFDFDLPRPFVERKEAVAVSRVPVAGVKSVFRRYTSTSVLTMVGEIRVGWRTKVTKQDVRRLAGFVDIKMGGENAESLWVAITAACKDCRGMRTTM